MKLNFKLSNIFFVLTTSFCTSLWASAKSEVCELIKKSKIPSAYLVDKNGKISRGPINYGKYPYIYKLRDTYTIPTEYKIIITPSKIDVGTCSENCLDLKKTESLCPLSQTYSVSYKRRDSNKNAFDRSWLPLKEHVDFEIPYDDPDSTYPIELKFHFQQVIEGEIYDATPRLESKQK